MSTKPPKTSAAIMAEIESTNQRSNFLFLLGIREAEAGLQEKIEAIEAGIIYRAGRRSTEDPWPNVLGNIGGEVGGELRSSDLRGVTDLLALQLIKSRPMYAAALAGAGTLLDAYESALAREAADAEATRAALETELHEINAKVQAEEEKRDQTGPLADLLKAREAALSKLNAFPAETA
jgi:hypothetical protein